MSRMQKSKGWSAISLKVKALDDNPYLALYYRQALDGAWRQLFP